MRVAHLLRKPISEGSVGRNVLTHGTGGLSIDAARVSVAPADLAEMVGRSGVSRSGQKTVSSYGSFQDVREGCFEPNPSGRWPANVLLVHQQGCVLRGSAKASGLTQTKARSWKNTSIAAGYAGEDGTEIVEVWDCAPGCAVASLEESAARFFRGFHGR